MEESVNPASLGNFVRTNGLQLPLNIAQVLSWIIMSFEICTTFLVLLPPLSLALKIASGVSISIFTLLTCYNACKACIINPTDPRVLQAKEARARGEIVRPSTKLYCSVCRAYVLLRTKHCGACNRCVDIFDHHCIWLNNCIGNSNYKYFIRAIAALLITSLLKFGFGIVLLVNYHVSSEDFQRNSQKYYNSEGRFNALYYIMIVSCVTNLVLFILLGKLTTFHIWLYQKGLTTYESIIMKRTNSQHTKKKHQTQTEASPTKSSRVIKNLEDEGSTAALNKTKSQHGITQTDNEIRLDTQLQDQTASKIDINPVLKSSQFELGSSETARFDTSPFLKKDSMSEKQVKKNEKIKKIKNSHSDLRTSNIQQEDNSKEIKQNETFYEEEKQDSQRNVILMVNNEETPYSESENRKSMFSNSNTNSSTSLIKGWSGKLFNKGPNVSRVFSIDSRTQSPSPSLTPGNRTPVVNREGGFGDNMERTSPIPFKVYTKVNALNLPEVRKEDEKGFDVSNMKSPCFGEPDVKNMTIDNKNASIMPPQGMQADQNESDPKQKT